jgi:hypothetical protein
MKTQSSCPTFQRPQPWQIKRMTSSSVLEAVQPSIDQARISVHQLNFVPALRRHMQTITPRAQTREIALHLDQHGAGLVVNVDNETARAGRDSLKRPTVDRLGCDDGLIWCHGYSPHLVVGGRQGSQGLTAALPLRGTPRQPHTSCATPAAGPDLAGLRLALDPGRMLFMHTALHLAMK